MHFYDEQPHSYGIIVRTEDAPIPQASLFIMAVEYETEKSYSTKHNYTDGKF